MPSGYAGCDLLTKDGVWYRGARRDCPADYERGHRAKNKEKMRKWHRDYHSRRYEEDPVYKQKHLEAGRHSRRKRKYGIEKDDYFQMVEDQKGLCLICAQEKGLELRVDHCHITGEIRGLLCANCNAGIGLFAEDPDRLTAAAAYVRLHATSEGKES